jgi:2-dehydro-3-deoxygluconokinase
MSLEPLARERCRWDLVSLGEVMLRSDPGDGRIATSRSFQTWEAGGEYNAARGLRRCFGLRTAMVTALVDNPVGRSAVTSWTTRPWLEERRRWLP